MRMTAAAGWAILRAWAEGERFDPALAASLTKGSARHIERRAQREGWRLDGGDTERAPTLEGIEEARSKLWRHLEAAVDDPVALDKARIDAIQSHMRTLDRLEESVRRRGGPQGSKEQQEEDDLAEAFAAIDTRIRQLAQHLAGQTSPKRA